MSKQKCENRVSPAMHAETAALNAPETYINPKAEPGTIAEIP